MRPLWAGLSRSGMPGGGRLYVLRVVDHDEVIEGDAGAHVARHLRLIVDIGEIRHLLRRELAEQAFLVGDARDGEIHDIDVDLRMSPLGAQHPQHLRRAAAGVVDDVDARVRLHERLDHDLGVVFLEGTGIGHQDDVARRRVGGTRTPDPRRGGEPGAEHEPAAEFVHRNSSILLPRERFNTFLSCRTGCACLAAVHPGSR